MRKTILILCVSLLSVCSFAQNECVGTGLNTLSSFIIADSNGVLRQNACSDSSGRLNFLRPVILKTSIFSSATFAAAPLDTTSPGTLSASLTPVASGAAIGVNAQAFTVTGIQSGDPIAIVSQPAPTTLCPVVAARATALNQVTLYASVMTAVACTPAAGTYAFFVAR